MENRTELMQMVGGRLFDGEWYERSELLRGSPSAESGYCVVVWTSGVAQSGQTAEPILVGPFPSADLALQRAKELR